MSGIRSYLFTVLTPTYNRADVLGRLYDSLCAQALRDFEWLIVDDGSTDSTRELVESWQGRSPFPIRYVWQPNGHKKTAFNHGVREAAGELVVQIDSDDRLEPGALKAMARVWAGIPAHERDSYAAVTGLCARPDGSIVGDRYPYDICDATVLDMSFRYHVGGEKFGCMRTDVLRRFPFPEDIPGFVPESLVWRRIARAGYLSRYVNEVFRTYYDSADSVSAQGRDGARYALGLLLLARDTVVECLPWFRYRPAEFFKAAARYTRFGLHLKHAGQRRPRGWALRGVWAHLLVAIMWPLGVLLYQRDRRRSETGGG
jgi:glycosyltransferase involved in cell wall biosynthesis